MKLSTIPASSECAMPVLHLPLKRAALCLDCEEIFSLASVCPACGSEAWTPLARFLERVVMTAKGALT